LSEYFTGRIDVTENGERHVAVRAIDRAGNIAVTRQILK